MQSSRIKKKWRVVSDRTHIPVGKSDVPTTLNIGFPEAQSAALVHLLTHYPWIVYLGYSLWRKLLVVAELTEEDDAGLVIPSLHSPQNAPDESQLSQSEVGTAPIGVSGDLRRFTAAVIPQHYLTHRIPLSDCSVQGRDKTKGS